MRAAVLAFIGAVLMPPALATDSPIELRSTLATLMERLPGRFDNAAQLFFEQQTGVPQAAQHGRVFRGFTRVEVPALGEHLLVAQVRYGGDAGSFDDGEFLLWSVSVDAQQRAVRMSPRRFRAPQRFRDRALAPAAFRELTAADLQPAEGAGSCDLYWRKYGDDLRGVTLPGRCRARSAALGRELDWSWEYVLTADELWLSYAGYDTAGRIVAGRVDQAHWRLGRARQFECLLGYTPPDGSAPQVNNGPQLHDRGGTLTWTTRAPSVRTFQYELLRGLWPSNSGRNYEDLLRLSMYQQESAEPSRRTLIGVGWASAASDRASVGNETYNARCKLFDPAAPPPKNE